MPHDDAPHTEGNKPHSHEKHTCCSSACASDTSEPQPKVQVTAQDVEQTGGRFKSLFTKKNGLLLASSALYAASLVNNDATLALVSGTAAVATMIKSCDYIMADAQILERDHGVPRYITAAMHSMFHAGPEFGSAIVGTVTGQSETAVVSNFMSKMTHLSMVFGGAVAGAVQKLDPREWTMHVTGMTALSAAYAAPILLENQMHTSVSMGIGASMILVLTPWYMSEQNKFGHQCITHNHPPGVSCNGGHDHLHDHHDHHDHHGHDNTELNEPENHNYRTLFAENIKGIGQRFLDTPKMITNIPTRMSEIPENWPAIRERTAELIKTPALRNIFICSATLGVSSAALLNNLDTLADGAGLAETTKGVIQNFGLSATEACLFVMAAVRRDTRVALGALGGCFAAGGLVEGYLHLTDADIPSMLRNSYDMSAYGLTHLAAFSTMQPGMVEYMKLQSKTAAESVKNTFGKSGEATLNWLNGDEHAISRWAALPPAMLLAAYMADAATRDGLCHTHGFKLVCDTHQVQQDETPKSNIPNANELLYGLTPD